MVLWMFGNRHYWTSRDRTKGTYPNTELVLCLDVHLISCRPRFLRYFFCPPIKKSGHPCSRLFRKLCDSHSDFGPFSLLFFCLSVDCPSLCNVQVKAAKLKKNSVFRSCPKNPTTCSKCLKSRLVWISDNWSASSLRRGRISDSVWNPKDKVSKILMEINF